MQVPDVRPGADDDRGVLLHTGQVIEIDHQLEVGIGDRVDEVEPLGGRS